MKKYYYTKEISKKLQSVKEMPALVNNYPEFNEQIKIIRETLGLTQQQLAQKAGTTARSIIRIEQGKMLPNVALLQKIAVVLNTDCKILLVPKINIVDFLEEKAEQKAQSLVGLARGTAAMEEQSPSLQAYQEEIEKTKRELIDKKRYALWDVL